MILCFDIDNVICKTNKTQYKKSTPNLKTIRLINEAYTLGARIILFTGRFYGRCDGNLKKIKKVDRGMTKKQLKKWGVKYHNIITLFQQVVAPEQKDDDKNIITHNVYNYIMEKL